MTTIKAGKFLLFPVHKMSEHGKWFEIVKLYIGYEPVFILLAWARHIEK